MRDIEEIKKTSGLVIKKEGIDGLQELYFQLNIEKVK